MFNVTMNTGDVICVATNRRTNKPINGCARRAASRVLQTYFVEKLPKATFSSDFTDELSRYIMDIAHEAERRPTKRRDKLQALLSPNKVRTFKLVLDSGITQAKSLYTPSEHGDATPKTDDELQFQEITNECIVQLLTPLQHHFSTH